MPLWRLAGVPPVATKPKYRVAARVRGDRRADHHALIVSRLVRPVLRVAEECATPGGTGRGVGRVAERHRAAGGREPQSLAGGEIGGETRCPIMRWQDEVGRLGPHEQTVAAGMCFEAEAAGKTGFDGDDHRVGGGDHRRGIVDQQFAADDVGPQIDRRGPVQPGQGLRPGRRLRRVLRRAGVAAPRGHRLRRRPAGQAEPSRGNQPCRRAHMTSPLRSRLAEIRPNHAVYSSHNPGMPRLPYAVAAPLDDGDLEGQRFRFLAGMAGMGDLIADRSPVFHGRQARGRAARSACSITSEG